MNPKKISAISKNFRGRGERLKMETAQGVKVSPGQSKLVKPNPTESDQIRVNPSESDQSFYFWLGERADREIGAPIRVNPTKVF